ncbi:outer membrane beta-barrel protein [Bdellovibrio bacteriovorus]|uniref:Outer membrane protein beta-barrel domain-containing protein n=1 Tax=Bdellovibrio bacteriovorus TaxID=959 RepID=A0A1Z3N8J2_BDEBC|nr:outer membrane beta-barrel protein [Bdellovibrio bacteriovorus]ASD63765.1 hypothetical protein B9G79_09355 [Bdellovibrio bacteriovorus]
MKTTARSLTYSLLILLALGLSLPSKSLAQSDHKSYLISQVDADEAYDPFTDYSEFEEESDEEADINFFRNGRFFTIGLAGGMRGFTGNFADAYSSAPTFGIFLTYFFDLRLAMSLGFQTGDHAVKFTVNNQSKTYEGNVSITAVNFDLKYYMNTQNVTRGLADLNPYILGGLGQFYRTYTIAGLDGFSRDSTMGFDIGAGLEIPLMRKKAYLGLQGTYHYVNFSDENKSYVDGTEKLDKNLTGDFYNFLVILGMNF